MGSTGIRSSVRMCGTAVHSRLSTLRASICDHLTKGKLIIFIIAAKILMLMQVRGDLGKRACEGSAFCPRPATFPGVSDRATLTPDYEPDRMPYHRWRRPRDEHGVRGSPGANYCPSAAPGTHLIRCLEATIPVRRRLPRRSQGRTHRSPATGTRR